MRTHVVRGWIAGILAMLAVVLAVGPARAHAELESSDPQDGATLAVAPTQVTFTFGEEILREGNAVTLTAVDAGARLEVGALEVDGDTVSVSWPESSPAGEFRAAYRVVSADGHPIDGTITFMVEQAVGAGQASPAAVSASASAASGSPAPATASPTPVSASDPVSVSDVPAEDEAGAGLLAWVLWIGLAVLIGVGGGAWVMRRTR